MPTKLKLSNPQLNLLTDIPTRAEYTVVDRYKPALKLIELGLVTGETLHGTTTLKLTDAGKQALEERKVTLAQAWSRVEPYVDRPWGEVLDQIRGAARTHKLTESETYELTHKAKKASGIK